MIRQSRPAGGPQESEGTIRAILESTSQAIVVADAEGKILLANRAAGYLFGYRCTEMFGRRIQALLPGHPQAARAAQSQGDTRDPDARPAGRTVDLRGRRKDGAEFPAEVSLTLIEAEDEILAVSLVTDVTERKRGEEALRRQTLELSERVKELNCLYGISRLIEKPGASLEEIIAGVVELIPSAWQRPELVTARIVFKGRVYRTPNFREANSKQTCDIVVRGKRAGAVEICHLEEKPDMEEGPSRVEDRDLITVVAQRLGRVAERIWAERKLRTGEAALRRSQAELRALAANLISVQEEERRRLARELHDGLNQELTAFALELARLEQKAATSPNLIRDRLKSMQERVGALSDEVRRVSHLLHPAVLEYLGLVTALEAECARFSKLAGIQVSFVSRNLPEALSPDVSFCLYRVAQETLRNVIRHSRSPRATVTLEGSGEGLLLSVQDFGEGFDPRLVRGEPRGLGLVSMEERLRLVNGTLSVNSRPGQGTEIQAWAPLLGRTI